MGGLVPGGVVRSLVEGPPTTVGRMDVQQEDIPQSGEYITVTGAHLHNLRHVTTFMPRGKIVAFTGVSGSGKSSLAFGSLHGEAQRRYLESIAPFARFGHRPAGGERERVAAHGRSRAAAHVRRCAVHGGDHHLDVEHDPIAVLPRR